MIIAVGIIAPAGVPEEMPQRTQEQTVRHFSPTFLGQHKKGHDMGAGRVEMSIPIGGEGTAAARPSVVVLRFGRVIDPFLDVSQNLWITGP